ncbi:hypothetical protein [Microbacterium maritypicum]|uniref:hypothetical protein n=1 Tax=Microbacterium maritypicum TaxID=33918 RepID=UPI0038152C9C
MTADIITDTTYPHGTAEGFMNGCRGSHCPAPMACRDVHTRYNGDFAFRRQINAGATPVEIVAAEEEQAREAARAELAAKKAEGGALQSAETREAARERHNAARRAKRAANLIPQKALIPRDKLAALLDEGLTDRQIGERLGFTRRQIAGARNTAKLPRNPDNNCRPAPATTVASSFQEHA